MAATLDRWLGENPVRLFDVGARGGIDQRWRRFDRYLHVLGFEPDRAECERLNRDARSLPYPSRFLPYMLGNEAREDVTFNVASWPVASSVYEPNAEFLGAFPFASRLLAVAERRQVAMRRLDSICAEESIAPDCLKIDVEGAELEVLRGAEEALLDALVIDVEVEFEHLFVGQPLFADVDRHLRERGWRLIGLRRTHWRRAAGLDRGGVGYGGQLVSADALYYNDRALDRGLSETRAMKLALILAAYRQFDFVLAQLRSDVLRGLSRDDLAALERLLTPRPPLWTRVAARALERLGGERRRALADGLQPGDATVWNDPHHF